MTKVLVTGGKGFLGSWIVDALGSREGLSVLVPMREELELTDEAAVLRYWRTHRPDAVIHAAAFARGLGGNISARELSFSRNEAINRNVLVATLDTGAESFVMAGTVAEYGYPYQSLPLVESDVYRGKPHAGEAYYSLAKRLAEPYLEALRMRWQTAAAHVLLTNMYGPRDRFDREHGHVVSSMLLRVSDAIRAGHNAVEFWGKPETTRDFLYVRDAANAVASLLGIDVGLVNVGTGTASRMDDLARIVVENLGYGGEVRWNAEKPIGIPNRSLDISHLREWITFNPIALDEGVQLTIGAEPWLLT